MEKENKNDIVDKKSTKKEPGYIVGMLIARLLWFIIILCMLAVGVAVVAGLFKLLIWYLTLIF